MGEDINETLDLYMHAAIEYELSADQRFKLFQNVFETEARGLYRPIVEREAHSLLDACRLIFNEFNSI